MWLLDTHISNHARHGQGAPRSSERLRHFRIPQAVDAEQGAGRCWMTQPGKTSTSSSCIGAPTTSDCTKQTQHVVPAVMRATRIKGISQTSLNYKRFTKVAAGGDSNDLYASAACGWSMRSDGITEFSRQVKSVSENA